MKNPFTEFKATILDSKPKNFELAGHNDKDMMFIKGVAIDEGVNANGALFERADIHKARYSFLGKPLKILFKNNNPTGHGYDPQTGEFSNEVANIGHIYDVQAEVVMPNGDIHDVWGDDVPEEYKDGKYRIVVYMAVWQKYFPEIALRLRQLHAVGDLKFSIEAERDFEVTPEGYRRCFNILFNGLAVVSNPAFENARSIIVAEIEKQKGGNGNMEYKELYEAEVQKNVTFKLQAEKAVADKELAEKELKEKDTELAGVKEEVITLKGEKKIVEGDRDKYKAVVEVAEKAKVGQERMAKLKKYGEVVKTADELAELAHEAFLTELEEAMTNYKPDETASHEDPVGVDLKTKGKETVNRKQAVIEILTGLANGAR